jgi:MYXO-CTERM domain-containing protein
VTVQVGPGVTIVPVAGPVHTAQQLTLAASGGSGTGFAWTVVSSGSGGTVVSATGVYTAGTHAGADVIRVTDSLGNTSQLSIPVVAASSASTPSGSGCGCRMATSGPGSTTRSLAWTALLALGLMAATRRRRSSGSRKR